MTEDCEEPVLRRSAGVRRLIVVVVVLCAVAGSYLLADSKSGKPKTPRLTDAAKSVGKRSDRQQFPVTVRPGPQAPQLLLETNGKTVEVNCNTCHGRRDPTAASTQHAGRAPDITNRRMEDLKEFHQGLRFSHHELSCLSCHNPNDYESLRMADGTRVEFPNVMKLCAQCHGNVYRDFLNGAHGGMTGYWDLTKGPRERNNCVDCHHPHTPQFPKMRPTFKPHDRFLAPHSEHD